ncbi:MAG: GNAT family N-acetyltransferase [Hydrogenibacillus sp.]|nr:GNAT family N-acetyltransferase [Hydrogenibacillus sp.]
MEHRKRYVRTEFQSPDGTPLIVEGPLAPKALEGLTMHDGLTAFRAPEAQKRALVEIAGLPEGRIIIARDGDTIVGYVTFHRPDPLERWAEIPDERLLELGGIEVAPPYRGAGLGKKLLQVAFSDPAMEAYLVYTMEFYWHWDLQGTGLSVWAYRQLMERLMGSAGLTRMATDDPDITAHPANCLMVRIGAHVPRETVEAFDRRRFLRRPLS